ncbi:NosD domain-containing protein, partial [Rhodopirellula bahusiensis]
YRFSRPIQLRSGVNLIGDGVGKTILEGRRLRSYLLNARRIDESKAFVTGLTLRNRYRTVAMYEASKLHFHHVEFAGGIVRLEGCSDISLEGNLFRDNLGKSGYASDNCDRIRIVHNRFDSIENGSINLSRHRDCYVAWNEITAESLLDSGYAGIRLPNDAMNNLVEHNFIENHGRGIFVLSSSENNVIRNNVVMGATKQGVLIQSSANRLESNVIVDAGEQSIYVVDAVASSSPTPSVADHNQLLRNLIYDTRSQRGDRFVALKVSTEGNTVVENVVSSKHGREFKAIRPDVGNVERDNEYRRDVDQDQVRSLVQSIKERVAEHLKLDESGQSSVPDSSGGR